MLDWMKNKPEKSDLEKEFDTLAAEYREKFGEVYPVEWGSSNMEEDIALIKICLKTNKPKTPHKFDTSDGKKDF